MGFNSGFKGLILNTSHADPTVKATSRQAVCLWCREMKVSDYWQHGRRKWLRHKSCSEFLINAFGHQIGSGMCHLNIWKQKCWGQNTLWPFLVYAVPYLMFMWPCIVLNFLQQNQLNALIFQIYSWNENLHDSKSSSVHHQKFFTEHTAMVYAIQVCWQLASRIRMGFLKFIPGRKLYMFRTVPLSIIRSFSLYTQQWYMSYRFADSLWAGSGWDFSNLFLE